MTKQIPRTVRSQFYLLALALAVGCSAPDDQELFEGTQAELGIHVGDSCDLGPLDGEASAVVAENEAACGQGLCVWQSPEPGVATVPTEGTCTCRCDGPKDEGPFCACPGGFVCQADVIADLGVAWSSQYAGGYCVAE